MISNALETATVSIAETAESLGADAVIAARLCSTEVAEGAAELTLYGTAIKHRMAEK
jgi:uncharacterized protein YbjQ (UPF0145 family)